MPLSTTNLVEVNATKLRVLKNGRMVDVLTLTANGTPDIGDDGLVISQIEGLQSQLNGKASTSALNATAASIGADLDGVEVTLGTVGATVGALGALVEGVTAAVATKADASVVQQGFTSANSNVSSLGTLINGGYATLDAVLVA